MLLVSELLQGCPSKAQRHRSTEISIPELSYFLVLGTGSRGMTSREASTAEH